jgi:hypothetical protein
MGDRPFLIDRRESGLGGSGRRGALLSGSRQKGQVCGMNARAKGKPPVVLTGGLVCSIDDLQLSLATRGCGSGKRVQTESSPHRHWNHPILERDRVS